MQQSWRGKFVARSMTDRKRFIAPARTSPNYLAIIMASAQITARLSPHASWPSLSSILTRKTSLRTTNSERTESCNHALSLKNKASLQEGIKGSNRSDTNNGKKTSPVGSDFTVRPSHLPVPETEKRKSHERAEVKLRIMAST